MPVEEKENPFRAILIFLTKLRAEFVLKMESVRLVLSYILAVFFCDSNMEVYFS